MEFRMSFKYAWQIIAAYETSTWETSVLKSILIFRFIHYSFSLSIILKEYGEYGIQEYFPKLLFLSVDAMLPIPMIPIIRRRECICLTNFTF